MANAFTFEIKGLKELQKKFDAMPKELSEEIDGEIESSMRKMVTEAKQDARKDSGTMARLTEFTGSNMNYTLFSKADYSPYQEFGTGNKVNVPSEVSGYGSQFKGRGLRKINIFPKPFFFKAFFSERPRLLSNVNNAIKRLLK